jgi:XTP/dITP diphosphohydrolase
VEILFATRNLGKAREVRALLAPYGHTVLTLSDLPELDGFDVEETETTFEGNALLKARAAFEVCGLPVAADDSGLVVDALDGAPGVYSARYAGPNATDLDNNLKLIAALQGVSAEERRARFVCAVVFMTPRAQDPKSPEPYRAFQGVVDGLIIDEPRGTGGFGYDPHFLLPDLGLTTAELRADEKNELSHRGMAFRQLAESILG